VRLARCASQRSTPSRAPDVLTGSRGEGVLLLHLVQTLGFVAFHLLKGLKVEDHTLYASHTVSENRADERTLHRYRQTVKKCLLPEVGPSPAAA
jgi:hypothetical protein